MPKLLTCRHCGHDHDALPSLPESFNTHELKQVLRDGSIPSQSTVEHIEREIAKLEAAIKEMNEMFQGACTALAQSLKRVDEYLTVARSLTSPIRKLPVELLSHVFLYLISSHGDWVEDMMLEAGIFDTHGSVGYRLASVCKYWWRVMHDTPVLHPYAFVRFQELFEHEALPRLRRYIEMTFPHPLKLCFSGRACLASDGHAHARAIVQELLDSSSRWRIVQMSWMRHSGLENISDLETEFAAQVYRSSYPVLKELCLDSFSTPQFFLPEQVPALRVLSLYRCSILLHDLEPILLQITDLDLGYFNHDVDLHAIISCAPALIKLTVVDCHFPPCPPRIRSDVCEPLFDTRSPILLSHLRQLHIEYSLFMLDFITAPGLSNLYLRDELIPLGLLEAFLCRSKCNVKSLDVDAYFAIVAHRLVWLLCQAPYVTHLSISAGPDSIDVWNTLGRCSSDGTFDVVPQLQHLEIRNCECRIKEPSSQAFFSIIRAVRKRCGAQKVVVEGPTGYGKSKTTHVLRRLDISCSLTWSQHRTLLALSECGVLDVCFTSNANPFVGNPGDDDHESEDEDEDDEEDSDGGDDDGIVYI
ncbi:hypothetical protein FISHEDRAFT_76398 [Fistulina hepatica ATCC 64428]|uniref:F-box domain-containing protein n=1 Tax=Fistulina hepatica ATCC 64428 TaxID=1128425 RepID=A0A0D7A6J9_9AGAR|nr:hypothetical protein FISHEDRAFT_76398 [Fistulina hepatica ATCC 64428]